MNNENDSIHPFDGSNTNPTQQEIDDVIERLATSTEMIDRSRATISKSEHHINEAVNLMGESKFLHLVSERLEVSFQLAFTSILEKAPKIDPYAVELMMAKANQFAHAANMISAIASMLDGLEWMKEQA